MSFVPDASRDSFVSKSAGAEETRPDTDILTPTDVGFGRRLRCAARSGANPDSTGRRHRSRPTSSSGCLHNGARGNPTCETREQGLITQLIVEDSRDAQELADLIDFGKVMDVSKLRRVITVIVRE
jgi:hypothetical protein